MNQPTEHLLKQIETLFEEKKYQDIINILTDETLDKANNAILYAYKARSYNGLEAYDNAVFCAKKALNIDPKLAMGYYSLGNIKRDIKQFDEAIENYNKAIELNDNYLEASCACDVST